MESVAGAKRRIDNKSCKIKYIQELEKRIAPKDVEYFISYFISINSFHGLSTTPTLLNSNDFLFPLGVRVMESLLYL